VREIFLRCQRTGRKTLRGFSGQKIKAKKCAKPYVSMSCALSETKAAKKFFVGFHRIFISNFIVIIQRTRKKHPKCTVRLFHFLNREFQGIAHFLTELTSKKLDGIFLPESLLLAN